MAGEWTDAQQQALDKVLGETNISATMTQEDKWAVISRKVAGKTAVQCAQRYLAAALVEQQTVHPDAMTVTAAEIEALTEFTKTGDGGASTEVGVLGTTGADYGGEHKVTIIDEEGGETIQERRHSSDIIASFQQMKQAQGTHEGAEGKPSPLEPTDDSQAPRNPLCPCLARAAERDTSKLKEELNMDEHSVDIEVLRTRLGTKFDVEWVNKDEDKFVVKTNKTLAGLTSKAVAEGLQVFGENALTPPATTPEWVKFCEQMTGFFSLLLWAGAILCFIGYGLKKEADNLYLGIVLASVVFLTGVFGYMQERKSSKLMESFKSMLPSLTVVVRDGDESQINARTLVPGDILKLKAGMKVPADIRILNCSGVVEVDNASLTGESEPQKRDTVCTDENPLETRNLAFFGTEVVKGSCVGLVVNTGDNTVMGRIAALTTETGAEQTPINKEIHHFVLIVSGVAFVLGISFFIIGAALGTDMITNLVFMIGIIVANVPEGLLATVTVCMALTAHRMANNNVLVKNLEGVETLGSTSCICSDKTGTLTQNMMTVDRVVYDLQWYQSECGAKKSNVNKDSKTFDKLVRCACLCNNVKWDKNSKYKKGQDGKIIEDDEHRIPFMSATGDDESTHIWWKGIGDATETALAKFCEVFNGTVHDSKLIAMHAAHKELVQIPFNSKNKYQCSVHENPAKKGDSLLVMKGAPERIWNRCSHIWLNGELKEFDDACKEKVMELQKSCAKRGLRVLGFAELELDGAEFGHDYPFTDDNPNFPLGNEPSAPGAKVKVHEKSLRKLHFLGLYAMIDPARPQVPGAVKKCKTAGIRVIMVTGDHPVTAKAIAKDVGIIWGDLKRSPPKDPEVSMAPDPKLGPATEEEYDEYNKKHGLFKPGEEIPCPFNRKKDGKTVMIQYFDPRLAPAIVVPGWELVGEQDNKELWDDILGHNQIVFARTSPQQKLIIVENCQNRSEIVAVTGDGVNDAPALKKADIGVAMGIMGSDVSKEAADMILLDDNFASIVAGVEEGRLIFDNLKKSIAYTLSSNIPEIAPFICFITIQLPLPLSTVLILCVDLGTDMVPAISMAWENAESDIMKRAPRDADRDRLVTKKLVFFAYLQIGVIQAIAGFYTWFVVMADYGFPAQILPGLGAYDNWGKQTLWCRPQGYDNALDGTAFVTGHTPKESTVSKFGVRFRNLAGVSLDIVEEMPWDEVTSDHIRNFPFWDGDVGTCTFALRSWKGHDRDAAADIDEPSNWKPGYVDPVSGDISEPSSTLGSVGGSQNLGLRTGVTCPTVHDLYSTDNAVQTNCNQTLVDVALERLQGTQFGTLYTREQPVVTSANFAALEAAGYRPYIPWKGRNSPFWEKKWLAADTWDEDILGFGEEANPQVHFSVEPPGLFNVVRLHEGESTSDKAFNWKKHKNDFCDECRPFGLTSKTKKVYEDDNCFIDTLPVSRVLGDFAHGVTLAHAELDYTDKARLARHGWEAGGSSVPMTRDTIDKLDLLLGQPPISPDGITNATVCCSVTRTALAGLPAGTAFGQDPEPNPPLDQALFVLQPSCSPRVWAGIFSKRNGVAGYTNFSQGCDFKAVAFDYANSMATLPDTLSTTTGVEVTSVTNPVGLLKRKSETGGLQCRKAAAIPVPGEIQHVYNIVDVRRYLPSKTGVNCVSEAGTRVDAECISVAYPNWKTASKYDLDGEECKSGICVNVASRMVQKEALHHAQCAYFVSIVIVQWADLVICKTRMNSIYRQGMLNPVMNFALIFETMLACILCYTPGVTTALGTRPIKFVHWFPACLYSCFIFAYDEMRKLIMRSTTTSTADPATGQVTRDAGWMERNTYY